MFRCEWAEEPGAVLLQCRLLLQVGARPSSLLSMSTTGPYSPGKNGKTTVEKIFKWVLTKN
jgi:hypothetical protein